MATDYYDYSESGIEGVRLVGGFEITDSKYGPCVRIREVSGLHREIAQWLVSCGRMDGPALRYLRVEMELAPEEAGILLGMDIGRLAELERSDSPVPAEVAAGIGMLAIERLGLSGGQHASPEPVFAYDGGWNLTS